MPYPAGWDPVRKGTVDPEKPDPVVPAGGYVITFTGNPYIGEPLEFSTNIPEGVKGTWIFRDGTSEPYVFGVHPVHTFTEQGSYMVIIVVEGDSLNTNGLNPYRVVNANYRYDPAEIAKMKTISRWHVIRDSVIYANDTRDTVSVDDDIFPVMVLNDTTLLVQGDTLKADPFNIRDGVSDRYTFNASGNTPFAWRTLYYYFKTGKAVYGWHPFQGGEPESGKRPGRPYGITTTAYSY